MRPTLTIPAGVAFDDLHLACVGDELQCDWAVFAKVWRASGYGGDALAHPELLMALLMRWYDAHCEQGGAPSLPMEQILARAGGVLPDGAPMVAPGGTCRH